MNARIIIALQGVLILALSVALWFFAGDEAGLRRGDTGQTADARPEDPERARDGVKVSAEQQEAGGIEVAPLAPARFEPRVQALGVVRALQPLVEARSRYLAAREEIAVARAALLASEDEYRRLKVLGDDAQNVSAHTVRAAEARWREDQARIAAAEQRAAGLRAEMRAHWGDPLAGWAVDSGSERFARLASHEEVIVQVVLAAGAGAAPPSMEVKPLGAAAAAQPATLVSASAQGDPALPGATYLYRAPGAELRPGMGVRAVYRGRGKPRDGVLVPEAAVVWYAGRAWVYVRRGDDDFERIEVDTRNELPGGWFADARLAPGDPVVVAGAVLLLSQEFKYQIKNENED